jgi:small subunit ribosomal protein S6
MTEYELTVITKAQTDEKKQNEIVEKAKSFITDNNGKVVDVQLIGKKPLATNFEGQNQGNFIMFKYEASGPQANNFLNDYLKINESIIRHLIVRIEKKVPKEPRKERKARKSEASAEKTE